MVKVTALPAHRNGCVQVEFWVTGHPEERFQLINVLELGITVEEQSSMIWGRFLVFVQLFQIFDQIVNTLCIEKLRSVS